MSITIAQIVASGFNVFVIVIAGNVGASQTIEFTIKEKEGLSFQSVVSGAVLPVCIALDTILAIKRLKDKRQAATT